MSTKNRTFSSLWRRRTAVLCAASVALFALVGCSGADAVAPPPTRTPAPTFTPTVAVEAQPVDPAALATAQAAAAQPPVEVAPPASGDTGTQPVSGTAGTTDPAAAAPTSAPAPTNTPEQKAQVTTTQQVNVRGGPSTNYAVIGLADAGQTFDVTGKNNAGDWWQIAFNGQAGWVLGQLVTAANTASVAVAQNIPVEPAPVVVAPPPTNTPAPAPPAEQPTAAPAAPPADNFPFTLGTTETCAPNPGTTYFNGVVRDSNNNLVNAVCIHLFYYEPRSTKCSGCDGVGDGNWGFAPFGGPAPRGTTVEIYVVPCEGAMPMGGQSQDTGFGNLTPQSPKWVHTINDSEQCTGITFYRK